MKTIGVLTSGGDAPGMNAAIRAVVRAGIFNGFRMMGIRQGYSGLINGDIDDMNLSSVADIIHRGGTMLRSARSDEFKTKEGFEKALNVLEVFGIDGLVVLGGDGTLKGARELSNSGIPTIGIPCTIDNDCGFSDFTIGFFTAVETVVDAISKIRDTSTSHGRANVIEVMGRHCGDIALYAGLAGGAESIIVPEVDFNIDEVCKKAIQGKNRGKLHHIIVLAEGVGNAYDVSKSIEEKTGIDTRVTILGYIQRGGNPTSYDRIIASKMGNKAIELLKEGKTDRALGIKCNHIVDIDIKEALEMKKEFDIDMYNTARILSI
ncbi:6-phosphofructokinase [Tissierella praeacuta DSM 18095]|uniref:ATP-dependent 6-phosphofructokinase n=1 Tax=Tissierella praeacuta DSM 18095 TaxID=1123404 RepID=A0A1M4UZQ3_9FIRM|nr:6-phosphofructokinase [Tissierella praeacuta]TCU74005.1 6-phosphofructokinase [Tissierella praeacuta]SHE62162.1 6-phosphofructokinase [Tissierella praeacuta DSM 18095]SUP02734.1 6-phosphofructokinase [Tissierella praeacuta]